MVSFTEGGICSWKAGSSSLMRSTTSTVLVPGWRCTRSITERASLDQAAVLSFSTLSTTRPSSSRRTARPLR